MIKHVLPAAMVMAALPLAAATPDTDRAAERIQPYAGNPRYWAYQGQPVVLLGASDEDNLFQMRGLEEHLRRLAAAGGNYVRNTMSARDPGNVQPFARRSDGRYDLERWNEEYWRRFEKLLRVARRHGIIVQIEVWDRFDYSRERWEAQPFNPKNNINYTYEQSRFAKSYPEHPAKNRQPFFYTTPKQQDNEIVFRYQRRFVDEMLRRALPYPNVLYCLDNETSGDEAWGAFWADYIRGRAREAGMPVFITEMWDDWDLRAAQHRRTLDHPRRYDFVEVSQNNHQRGDRHWERLQWVRAYLEPRPRPMNAVKTYGADTPHNTSVAARLRRRLQEPALTDSADDYGTTQQGAERWWRALIAGVAGVRFHRPPSGLGLNAEARRHIRSARLFLREFDIIRAVPDAGHERLGGRARNEAYLTRIGDEAFAVYFPDGGSVRLTLPGGREYTLRWLDIRASRWSAASVVGGESVRLEAPGRGHRLALVRSREPASALTR